MYCLPISPIDVSTLNQEPRAILAVYHLPRPTFTDMKYTVLGALPAGAAATGEANYSGIALDLAYTAGQTRFISFEGAFPGFSLPLWRLFT